MREKRILNMPAKPVVANNTPLEERELVSRLAPLLSELRDVGLYLEQDLVRRGLELGGEVDEQ